MRIGETYSIKKRSIDSEKEKILSVLAPIFSAMNKIRMRCFSGPWPFGKKKGNKKRKIFQ
mgnify:CR=1 FL=1